jgi:predicted metal-dependent peptidase
MAHVQSSGPLTSAEKKSVYEDVDRIIAKALRDNHVFMPLALELMNYEIIITGNELVYKGCPAMTDYSRIWINIRSDFFEHCRTAGQTFAQTLATLLFHEVGHPLLYHDKRRRHRDPALWNSAADYVINLLLANLENESAKHHKNKLVDLNIRRIPDDKILLSDSFENMIEEEIYNELLKKQMNKKVMYMSMEDFLKAMGSGSGDEDDGDSNDDSDGGGEPKISEDPDDIDGPAVTITEIEIEVDGKTRKMTHVEFPEMKAGSPEEEKQQKKRNRNLQMNRKQFENTLMKGVGDADLKQFLGRLFKVKIDWGKILKDSLLTALQKGHDQVWHKPRTIWLANPYMPYLPNVDDEEVRGVAFFSIDESGSMSNDDIKKAISLVVEADDHYKSLCVIKHDDSVSKIYHYDEEHELTEEDIEELCTRQRCGGTSHKDVFRQINKFLKENPEENASVYVGCTDLYSDIQSCQDDLASHIPRIWLVNSEYHFDGLIGRVIRLK